MAYTSCKRCVLRRDCWIRDVFESRTMGNPDSPIYELVLQASRGECPLYTTEGDIMGV